MNLCTLITSKRCGKIPHVRWLMYGSRMTVSAGKGYVVPMQVPLSSVSYSAPSLCFQLCWLHLAWGNPTGHPMCTPAESSFSTSMKTPKWCMYQFCLHIAPPSAMRNNQWNTRLQCALCLHFSSALVIPTLEHLLVAFQYVLSSPFMLNCIEVYLPCSLVGFYRFF
jgi:hypothetical protein